MEPTLDKIRALTDLLGEPQRAYPVIHVTGTNGKTSSARMIDALLRGFGLRVGRFTSPHLESITERITVDGEPLSPERFAAAFDDVLPYVEMIDARYEHPMSFFEVLTAMAYSTFADTPVDVAVIEVGLGGSWDATNVADGQVALITPIDLDHTRLLGPTVTSIATEKAGIIKPGATVVTAVQPAEAAEALLRRSVEVEATVAREGLEFGVLTRAVAVGGQLLTLQGLGGAYDEIFLPVFGAYQAANAAGALAAVEAFFGGGQQGQIDPEVVRQGFAQVTSPGRLEPVGSNPTVLVDAAHNPAGMAATVAGLADDFDFRRLIAVVAVLAEKNARGMLEALEPVVDTVVVTQNSSPRRLPVDDLAAVAVEVFGADRVEVTPRLDDALDAAVRLAEEDPEEGPLSGVGVLVTGSVITAGEARTLLRR
ncbi:MAG: bifunctional folylpolyglutamate synthase/dihydrofolate synthase [Actinomycetota bacterium]|nr:bifunctional folylpolyglutamate synthase/dihydrofolate synthase [Actinomycetota bacterium]